MTKEISAARQQSRNLFEHEAMDLLSNYRISVPQHIFAESLEEAAAAAREIGFPVVLKIVSKDILHKSEAGEYRWASNPIMSSPKAIAK